MTLNKTWKMRYGCYNDILLSLLQNHDSSYDALYRGKKYMNMTSE